MSVADQLESREGCIPTPFAGLLAHSRQALIIRSEVSEMRVLSLGVANSRINMCGALKYRNYKNLKVLFNLVIAGNWGFSGATALSEEYP
jgi:hypothetical protein